MISRDDVAKLADLSLIDVSPQELDAVAGELDAILGYVGEVTKLGAEEGGLERPAHRNVMRDDVVTHTPGSFTERILAQAPETSGSYLRVKKVL